MTVWRKLINQEFEFDFSSARQTGGEA